MINYTIYCTETQTHKALELGAPIEVGRKGNRYFNIKIQTYYDNVKKSTIYIPTAEQMIGWLEDQGIWIHFCKPNQRPNLLSFSVSNINEPFRREFVGGEYSSRRDATLTAIDAALDYLVKIKEEKE